MNLAKIAVPFVASLLLFTGCSQKVEQKKTISKANFQKVYWSDLDGFKEDNLEKALKVFQKDCMVSKKYSKLKSVCSKAHSLENLNHAEKFFTDNFTPYQLISNDGKKDGLITGYYEPVLKGSYYKSKRFKYPIFAVPSNLIKVNLSDVNPKLESITLRGKLYGKTIVPYETREEIETINYQQNRYLNPICYVDDKIDLFFLHIQGSGKIQLPNGKFLNVGYGDQNGRSYYSIGRKLIQIGAIKREDVSLQSIRKWLKANPQRQDEILNLNQSYIFFNKSAKAATGSLGTQLTAQRNIAVDKRNIPLGFPVFVNTTNPITDEPISKLMVAADTGGAIKGKVRADLFFGNGEQARELAGKMKQQGELFIFVPNDTQITKD